MAIMEIIPVRIIWKPDNNSSKIPAWFAGIRSIVVFLWKWVRREGELGEKPSLFTCENVA
jgi:hypothetical protein